MVNLTPKRTVPASSDQSPAADRGGLGSVTARWAERLALLFGWAVVFGVFVALKPSEFTSTGNLANIFGSQSVLLVLTLGVLVTLTAGDYDLSSGSMLQLASIVIAVLNVNHGVPIVWAVLIALVVGAAVGLLNGILVVWFKNDPFIITLGTGTVLTGVVYWVSDSNTITGLSNGLSSWVYGKTVLGIPIEFYYGLAIALIMAYVWAFTPLGRRILLVGQARDVARLSGIAVDRTRIGAFMVTGLLAAAAGVLYAGTTGSASPSDGAQFLLPAFAAAFLGSTCLTPGRFNPGGAVVAVYFLATGIVGLELLGAQSFVQQLFYGGSLVVAVTAARFLGSRRTGRQL